MTTEPHEGFVPEWTRGDRLRKARLSAGYTVKQFAEATLISGKTITDYEGDRIERVSALRLEKWATVTGVSLHWIETGEAAGPTDPGGLGADDGTRTRNILLGMTKLRAVASVPMLALHAA